MTTDNPSSKTTVTETFPLIKTIITTSSPKKEIINTNLVEKTHIEQIKLETTIIKNTTEKTIIQTTQYMKTQLILLGFSSFIYFKQNKIGSFLIHLVPINGYIYSSNLIFLINIQYKILRKLEEIVTEQVKCSKIIREYENNIIYNCTFGTNGKDIDNIEIKNILEEYDFIGQDVEIIAVTPLAMKYMDNLQNVANEDLFNKKIYILDQSIISVYNENWIVDIIGVMNDKDFNYSKINLTISLLSSDSKKKIENISCTTEKLYKENVSLNCLAENEMSGKLESAVSDLEKDILVINLLNTSNNTINFISRGIDNGFYHKSLKRLSKGSKGAIIAIVLVLTFVLIITGIMLILFRKKRFEQNIKDDNETSKCVIKKPSYRN